MRDQKILIVDDSEMNRALLAEILEEQYQMEEAENGLEAIDILSRRAAEFSLILLDIFMPKCSGFEVLAYMNEYRLLENTAVIMISSDDSNESIKSAGRLIPCLSATGYPIRCCCMPSSTDWPIWWWNRFMSSRKTAS